MTDSGLIESKTSTTNFPILYPYGLQAYSRKCNHHKARKPLSLSDRRASLSEKTAATYSPTGVQYHRRGRA